MNFKPQVPKEHYFQGYDTIERWVGYWYQIHEVLQTESKNVLEIGPGNKTVSSYLGNRGIQAVTADIDKNLEPDYICNVTELNSCFKEKSFDTVLCSEVLEHIPFGYFEKSLEEMKRVARNYVVMTLPYFGIDLTFNFRIHLHKTSVLSMKIPLPRQHRFDGQHYWEIGKRHYPLSRISKTISKFFKVKKMYIGQGDPYHILFVLTPLAAAI